MAVLPPDPLFCLRSNMGHVHSVCFADNEDGCTDTLLAATEDGMVYFWDLERNRLKYKQGMGIAILSVHFYKGTVITQEKQGLIKTWSLQDTVYINAGTYECASGFCKAALFKDTLILPQNNCSIDIVDANSLKLLKRFKTEKGDLGQLMTMNRITVTDRDYLIGGFESGDVILWDYEKELVASEIKLRECITSITFDSFTLRGVVGNASNALQVFTIDKNLNMALKCELMITNEGCNIVRLRNDSKILVSGGWDGRLRLFSWRSLRLLVVLSEHRDGVTDIQFSNSVVKLWGNKIFAAASGDGIISLWSLYN